MQTQSHIDKVMMKTKELEYGYHVGSPAIKPMDITPFKQKGLKNVDELLGKKYQELLEKLQGLQNSYLISQEVYSSKFSFEPIIGQVYHLYENNTGNRFLSIIKPSEWKQTHIYSVILNSDMTWSKI